MDKRILFITLQNILGFSSGKLKSMLKEFKTAENIFSQSQKRLKSCGFFTENQISKILNPDFKNSERILNDCINLGINVLCFGDKNYPLRLAEIHDPPAVLYVLGDLPDIDNEVVIAMVGTRKFTKYGKESALKIAYNVALAGGIIVSGGAIGIDSFCHRAAIAAGRKTVAVLGCGIYAYYLKQNSDLRREIVSNGALISEYPPYTPVQKFYFPERNRIISGLSLGTAVIEAGEKSGSLITASCASEQGRDVFVLPANINEPSFKGSNNLLKNGAKPIFSAMDILEEYNMRFSGKIDIEKIPSETQIERILNKIDLDPSLNKKSIAKKYIKSETEKLNQNSRLHVEKADSSQKFILPAIQKDLSDIGRV